MNFHDVYYQTGMGGRGVSNVFVGAPRMRGHGLGSWFSGIFRSALPYLAKGARAIGKEAVRTGVNILDDVTENKMSFKDSFKTRMNESGKNLKRKATEKIRNLMEGSGYNHSPNKRRRQSRRGSTYRRIGSRKRTSQKCKRKAKRKSKSKSKINKRNTKKKKKTGVKTSKKKLKRKFKAIDIFN